MLASSSSRNKMLKLDRERADKEAAAATQRQWNSDNQVTRPLLASPVVTYISQKESVATAFLLLTASTY